MTQAHDLVDSARRKFLRHGASTGAAFGLAIRVVGGNAHVDPTLMLDEQVLHLAAAGAADALDHRLLRQACCGHPVEKRCGGWPLDAQGLQLADVMLDGILIATRPSRDDQLADRNLDGRVALPALNLELHLELPKRLERRYKHFATASAMELSSPLRTRVC